MKKNTKFIVGILIFAIILFIGITTVNAAVEVTKNKYSSDGSMKLVFTGLELDTTHEYEFALTKNQAEEITDWYGINEFTGSSATLNFTVQTKKIRDVIKAVDTGYVTIKDKTGNNMVLEDYAIDLSTPYLEITNYTVINNGKECGNGQEEGINIYLRNPYDGTAYFQYEKITDENVINQYKQIKSQNGDFTQLEGILKTTPPTSGWTTWDYYNGYGEITGYGYPQKPISVPDTGLYYMWIYFAGDNLKPLYGYILVDNLESEIALDSISLPKTEEVELGKTLKLTPTFSPSTTTNKIITWTSSDETVATVSNAGVVTPIKVGSTIITVTSQDGNKTATCTVTVTEASNGTSGSSNTSGNSNTVNGGNTSGTSSTGSTSTNGSSSSSTTSTSFVELLAFQLAYNVILQPFLFEQKSLPLYFLY